MTTLKQLADECINDLIDNGADVNETDNKLIYKYLKKAKRVGVNAVHIHIQKVRRIR